MQSCLKSVFLRFDTYLLSEDLTKIVGELRNISHGIPSEIPFDDMRQQIIDIDSVAELHNVYINTILDSKKIFHLRNAEIEGIRMDIYVNTFFIAFNIQSDNKIEDSVKAIENSFLNHFCIPTDFCYLRLNYAKTKVKQDKLWTIFDKSAFPIMDDIRLNGRYLDTVNKDGIFIDLSRVISSSDEDENLTDVYVQTKAVFETPNSKESIEDIHKAVSYSKDEISRCFR